MPTVLFPRHYIPLISKAFQDSEPPFSGHLLCPVCSGLRFWITDATWNPKLGGAIDEGMPLADPHGQPVLAGSVPLCRWCAHPLSSNLSIHLVRQKRQFDFAREAKRTERAW